MSDNAKNDDARFRDRLLAALQWVADRDPVAAAKLVAEYADDLLEELAHAGKTAPNGG